MSAQCARMRNYIEGPFTAGAEHFLLGLAKDHSCRLISMKSEKISFWTDRVSFEFEGPASSLKALQEDLSLSLIGHNLPERLKENQAISELEKAESDGSTLRVAAKTARNSNILELAQAIGDEIGVYVEGREEKLGWFRGKRVEFEASSLGSPEKLRRFTKLFSRYAKVLQARSKPAAKPFS